MDFFSISFVVILSYFILIELLKIIKLFLNPNFLRHEMFDSPKRKVTILFYHLCAIMIFLVAVLDKLGVNIF